MRLGGDEQVDKVELRLHETLPHEERLR